MRKPRHIWGIWALVLGSGLLFSCEETFDLDLENEGTRIVIDARIIERNPFFPEELRDAGLNIDVFAIVTRSADVFDALSFTYVDDALVTIEDNTGRRDTLLRADVFANQIGVDITGFSFLNFDQPFFYVGNFEAIPGRQYTLTVVADGQTFVASDWMPPRVELDSLSSAFVEEDLFFEDGYRITVYGAEPDTLGNNYFIQYTVNDTIQTDPNQLQYTDDEFVNGNYIIAELFDVFELDDSVEVYFMSVPISAIDYYDAYAAVVQGGGSPFAGPPANPPTNLVNPLTGEEALGLFFVGSQQTLRGIIRADGLEVY